MASVNKKFAVEKGLEVGDDALVVDADNNKTGIGKTNPLFGLDVASTANFDGIVAAGQVGIGSTQPTENFDLVGDAKFGGKIKDNNETLDAEKPKPLKPLTVDAKSIIPQKNKNSKNDKSIVVNI